MRWKGREELEKRLSELPPYTGESVREQLHVLDEVEGHIKRCEGQIGEVLKDVIEILVNENNTISCHST
jgi:hypothetical protein